MNSTRCPSDTHRLCSNRSTRPAFCRSRPRSNTPLHGGLEVRRPRASPHCRGVQPARIGNRRALRLSQLLHSRRCSVRRRQKLKRSRERNSTRRARVRRRMWKCVSSYFQMQSRCPLLLVNFSGVGASAPCYSATTLKPVIATASRNLASFVFLSS